MPKLSDLWVCVGEDIPHADGDMAHDGSKVTDTDLKMDTNETAVTGRE